MAKYHINGNGEVKPCRAREGNCPFGGFLDHYTSKEAAQERADWQNRLDAMPPLSKEKQKRLDGLHDRFNDKQKKDGERILKEHDLSTEELEVVLDYGRNLVQRNTIINTLEGNGKNKFNNLDDAREFYYFLLDNNPDWDERELAYSPEQMAKELGGKPEDYLPKEDKPQQEEKNKSQKGQDAFKEDLAKRVVDFYEEYAFYDLMNSVEDEENAKDEALHNTLRVLDDPKMSQKLKKDLTAMQETFEPWEETYSDLDDMLKNLDFIEDQKKLKKEDSIKRINNFTDKYVNDYEKLHDDILSGDVEVLELTEHFDHGLTGYNVSLFSTKDETVINVNTSPQEMVFEVNGENIYTPEMKDFRIGETIDSVIRDMLDDDEIELMDFRR